MQPEGYSTWLEIDLGAIQNNYRQLARISQRPVMAVVKANAYGHGLVRTSQALSEIGASWLGVARFEEAANIRLNWISTDLLVLGYTAPIHAPAAAKDRISLAVFDPQCASEYAMRAAAQGMVVQVHVKINTGMNRLGIAPGDALEFIRWLKGLTGIEVAGVFTHFARADEPDQPATDEQLRVFNAVVEGLSSAGLRPRWVHASNSGAVFNFPQAGYDLVRCGISLYGLHPSQETQLPDSFRPGMSWKTILTTVRQLQPGSGVGYNHRYVTRSQELIGTIPAGYADGFRRIIGNKVLVGGKLVPVVGTVCMDQCMVQLDSVPNTHPGDEVVLIGRQESAIHRVEDVAALWGTINYEVACGMADRLPRVFITE
jgi:alanine racemase